MTATDTRLCARCRHVLVDQDGQGWYYQVPVTSEEIPGLVFMDRVHQCDAKPHLVIAPENASPRCELCDGEESHPFHVPDYKFSGRHAFKATASAATPETPGDWLHPAPDIEAELDPETLAALARIRECAGEA